MALEYNNPYAKSTRFEHMYPRAPFTKSATSLLAPHISTCPTKKYSRNSWYDYKSSNPQITERVMYRMRAEYYRMQAMDGASHEPHQHLNTCLMCADCKKSPFQKTSLLDADNRRNRNYLAESFSPHWTESDRNMFRGPQSLRNATDSVRQYADLRQKMAIPSEHSALRDAFGQAYDRRDLKMTFGQQKFRLIDSQQFPRRERVESRSHLEEQQTQQQRGGMRTRQYSLADLKKQVSQNSRNVSWRGKTYFQVKMDEP